MTTLEAFIETEQMLYDAGLNLLPSLEKDVVFGLNNEPIVIDKLTKYFNEPIEKTKSKYCRYDAISSTTKYEIKSRRSHYSNLFYNHSTCL